MRESTDSLFHAGRRNKSEVVAERIEQLLREQRLRPGDRLPPERELVDAFGVALPTVRRALDQLESRGLIERLPRRGTFYLGNDAPPPVVGPGTTGNVSHAVAGGSPVPTIFSHDLHALSLSSRDLLHPGCCRRWEAQLDFAGRQMTETRLQLLPPRSDDFTEAVRDLSPDIVLATERELNELEQAGLLAPLPERQVQSWFRLEDFHACTHHATMRSGKLRGIPYYISASLKLWNNSLLAQAGGELPPIASAAALAPLIDSLDRQSLPAIAGTFIHMPLYQWLEDGIVRWDPESGESTLDEAAAIDSLHFSREMFSRLCAAVPNAMGAAQDIDPAAVLSAFVAGRLLVLDSFSYALGHLPDTPGFGMRVQPPPRMPGDTVSAHTSLLAITASCIERERACDFIRLACDTEGQRLLASTLHNIPARRDVAASPHYLGHCPPGMAQVLAGLDKRDSIFHSCPIVLHLPLQMKALAAAMACYLGRRTPEETVESLAAILRLMTTP